MDRASIRDLLATNDRAVERAIVQLYRRQLADEQQAHATMHDNGMGYNSADARVCSEYARRLLAGGSLMHHEMADARQRSYKYAGQLLDIAIARSFGIVGA